MTKKNPEGQPAGDEANREPDHAKVKAFVLRQFSALHDVARHARRKYLESKQNSSYGYPGSAMRFYLAERWNRRYDLPKTFWEVWDIEKATLALTIIVAFATLAQAYFMRRGIDQTQDVINQMRLEQRPWLAADGPPRVEFAETNLPKVTVKIKNWGLTPAKTTHGVTRVFARPPGVDIHADVDETMEIAKGSVWRTVITPNTTERFDVSYIAPEPEIGLERDLLGRLQNGTQVLYVVCVVYYESSADKPHWSRMCFAFGKDTRSPKTHSQYNEMK